MPWNALGSVLVGTAWQFGTPFPGQQFPVIRLFRAADDKGGIPLLCTLRRDQGQWFWSMKAVFTEQNSTYVIPFEQLPTGLLGSNFQVGLLLRGKQPSPIAVAMAYWTN